MSLDLTNLLKIFEATRIPELLRGKRSRNYVYVYIYIYVYCIFYYTYYEYDVRTPSCGVSEVSYKIDINCPFNQWVSEYQWVQSTARQWPSCACTSEAKGLLYLSCSNAAWGFYWLVVIFPMTVKIHTLGVCPPFSDTPKRGDKFFFSDEWCGTNENHQFTADRNMLNRPSGYAGVGCIWFAEVCLFIFKNIEKKKMGFLPTRSGRLWCRASQVQQGSGEGSGEPGQVQQDLRPFNSWKPSWGVSSAWLRSTLRKDL